MAQFDVYLNPNTRTRKLFPYVVDIQNPVISGIATRIVVPLGKVSDFKNEIMTKLTPEMDYKNEKLVFLTPQLASIPAKSLKNPVGTIAHMRDDIIAALDFAITGIWLPNR